MAATWERLAHISSLACAFAVIVAGLHALAPYPLVGVLLTLGGMAMLLFAAAGLSGAPLRRKNH